MYIYNLDGPFNVANNVLIQNRRNYVRPEVLILVFCIWRLRCSGSWETRQFKPYNFNAKGAKIEHGSLHPLLKVRTEFRSILLEMGFEEMPTNQYIESSFFNFDTLFQPQQHPARYVLQLF